MWKFVVVVQLEFDTLFKVDEIELNLIWAVVESKVCDQCMHHRRLAGASLSGNEYVLARAFTKPH